MLFKVLHGAYSQALSILLSAAELGYVHALHDGYCAAEPVSPCAGQILAKLSHANARVWCAVAAAQSLS